MVDLFLILVLNENSYYRSGYFNINSLMHSKLPWFEEKYSHY